MFASISSCQPSSTVFTSFKSSKNQNLIINQPVRVTGPNIYYVESVTSVTSFRVSTESTAVGTDNGTIHVKHGITYKIYLNNPDDSLEIVTTAGIEYSTGIRFVSPTSFDYFAGRGIPSINITGTGSNTIFFSSVAPDSQIAVWRRNSPAAALVYQREGIDFVFGTFGGSRTITFNSVLPTTGLAILTATNFTLSSSFNIKNYSVRVDGTVRTAGVDYGIYLNKIGFVFSIANSQTVSVELLSGMSGYLLFTPTVTTPATLIYRSRKTPSKTGIISVSSNGTLYNSGTKIVLKTNEVAQVNVTTPANYLAYQSYEYFLDGMQNYFAVVNKNNYNPIIKIQDRIKKYHNYANYNSTITVYDGALQTELGSTTQGLALAGPLNTISYENVHIILDVPNFIINIYSYDGGLLKSIGMPDFPISYEKYTYIESGQRKTDIFVLCSDGILYRLKENNQKIPTRKFEPAVRDLSLFDSQLPFMEDVPFKGSFTTFARRNLARSLFPIVVGFAFYGSNTIWMAGSNQVNRITLSNYGATVNSLTINVDEILNIVSYDGNGCIITTIMHRIYYLRNNASNANEIGVPTGHFTQILPGSFVLGTPCTMPFTGGGRVAIPDCHNHRLIVISNFTVDFIPLGDFVPAYARRFGNTVYVTGHDSNQVIKIELTNFDNIQVSAVYKITRLYFSKKVTVVSVVGDKIIAHHYMNDRTTLNFTGTGIKKVIPVSLDYREGPSSAIGTLPKIITLLGESTVTPVAGPYITWWVNGSLKANLNDGNYLGVVYRASNAGPHRSFIILGENAIDYDTRTISSETVYDYYRPFSYNTNYIPVTDVNYVEPINVLGTYSLPFSINFFGNVYNTFDISKNGILSFNSSYPINTVTPDFASVETDALLIEPRSLYQDRPIDNRNVANVTWGNIVGNITPGVYYTSGIIGEFQFYKLKFLGTRANIHLNGIVRQTVNVEQSGTRFNMKSLGNLYANLYVSNPISSAGPPYATIVSTGPVVGSNVGLNSTKVANTFVYSFSTTAYYTEPNSNIFYLDTPLVSSIEKYSNISDITGRKNFDWYNGIYETENIVGNNIILVDRANNKIIIEGLTNTTIVNNNWVFTYNTITTTSTVYAGLDNTFGTGDDITGTTTVVAANSYQVGAQSISSQVLAFSPVAVNTGNVRVQIAANIYSAILIGQKLTSDLYLGYEKVVGKNLIVRTYEIFLSPRGALEGATFLANLTTSNVDDGTVFTFAIESPVPPVPGQVTIDDFGTGFRVRWPNTTLSSVFIPSAMTFSLPIFGNRILIDLNTRQRLDEGDPGFESSSPRKSFRIRVTGVEPGKPTSIVPALPVTINSTGSSRTGSPLLGVQNYYIYLENPYTSTLANVFLVENTIIQFPTTSPIPLSVVTGNVVTLNSGADSIAGTSDDVRTTVSSSTTIEYNLYKIKSVNRPFDSINSLTTLVFSGNFLILDVAQTLPQNTPMLFIDYINHPPVEYHVGFYVGRNFQYIEYNYVGQPQHDNLLTVGLKNGAGTEVRQVITTPPDVYSHLFGSDAGTGSLINFGPGEFVNEPVGAFLPRYPRFFRERVFDETNLRYDIYIDFKIPSSSAVRASLDYGYLKINDGGIYDGTVDIKQNDIISVHIPFDSSKVVSAVIFSLGNTQWALPAAPESEIKTKLEKLTTVLNQPKVQNITQSFFIDVTGAYMVPDYFKNASGTGGAELTFERWVKDPITSLYSFNSILQRGSYTELSIDDEIKVSNIFTGYRDYNIIEVIFAGVEIIRLQVRTVNPPDLVNYITYPVLNQPFTFQKKMGDIAGYVTATVFLPTPGYEKAGNLGMIDLSTTPVTGIKYPTITDDVAFNIPEYASAELPLTVASFTTKNVNLFVDGYATAFIVNGVRTQSNNITVLAGQSTLGLEWEVQSYYASNPKIWQITYDPIDTSPVYTEVGEWPVIQRVIDGPLLVNGLPGQGKSVKEVKIINGGKRYNGDTIEVTFSSPPSGEAARGFPILNAEGTILAIVLITSGFGYVTEPTVNISGTFTANDSITGSAVSILVDNVLSRETWLALNNQAKQESVKIAFDQPTIAELEVKNYLSVANEPMKFLLDQNYTLSNMEAVFSPSEFNFIKQTQIQTSYLPQSFLTRALPYIQEPYISYLRASQDAFPTPSTQTLVLSSLTYGNIYNPTQTQVTALDATNLPHPTIAASEKSLSTWASNPTMFKFYTNIEQSQQSLIKYSAGIPVLTPQVTSFLGQPTRTYSRYSGIFSYSFPVEFMRNSRLVANITNNQLYRNIFTGNIFGSNTVAYINSFRSTNISQLKKSVTPITLGLFSKYFAVTTFKSNPYGTGLQSASSFSGKPMEQEYLFITQINYKTNYDYLYITRNTPPMPIPFAIPNATESKRSQDADIFSQATIIETLINGKFTGIESTFWLNSPLFTLTDSKPAIAPEALLETSFTVMSWYNQGNLLEHGGTIERTLTEEQYFSTSITSNIDQQFDFSSLFSTLITNLENKLYTLLTPVTLEPFVINDRTVGYGLGEEFYVTDLIGSTLDSITYIERALLPTIDSELNLNNQSLTILDPYFSIDNNLYLDFNSQFVYISQVPYILEPLNYIPSNLYLMFDPELIFQDKLFVTFDPELIFQDKLFVTFDPELIFQDKLFVTFDPLQELQPNLFLDLDIDFYTNPDRNIPFNPLQELQPNLFLDLDIDFYTNPDRYIPFDPELYRETQVPITLEPWQFTTGLLIPFEALLYRPTDYLINLTPWQFNDGILITMEWTLNLTQDRFISMNWELFRESYEWYQEDSFTYGAYKTEFGVYADDGYEGDQGQHKGSPPGTLERPRGPFLPYASIGGSALLSKTTYYGLGGFIDQSGANTMAAKYVSASSFQVVGTNIWNYRIHFANQKFTVKKSTVFPRIWYIRGA